MRNKIIFALIFFKSISAFSATFLNDVKRDRWGDLEVVWIEDNKFPRYNAIFYFQDGALNEEIAGLTQAAFEQMSSGTSKANQEELSDFFDFYATKLKRSVTHEYSTYSIQGLTKDIVPVVTKVCEMFKDAQFPEKELSSYVSRSKNQIKSTVNSHSALADRVFREMTLAGTPYAAAAEGRLESFDKLTSTKLKQRLSELNKARKVLYLSGPVEAYKLKEVIAKNCPWSSEKSLSKVELAKPAAQTAIYLVPVEGANQAQIRIGRYVTAEEIKGKNDNYGFLAGFLGGGFTSKLVQELRVKRGLTYSAGAYVSMQRDYGRAGIMTFSKTETTAEAISIIRDIFSDLSANKINQQEFKHQQGHQIGSFAFSFEETNAFLTQIMIYDHQKRSLSELEKYPEIIGALTPEALSQANLEAFPWERLTIVVVGDKSLEKSLSRIRPVRILDYKKFL
jgi:zinc protease